ncbi:glycerol-3-phosphate dehydrogenase/oxidase [Hoeflea poritis]|uniref:Glycerol-3-phosphate dehydrogenase/oxidase n=1 Tax=Hoeflea poritis TaxID=2993659 RepID=A0ABT4VRJ2_9HYPH|nr:glycerol-3-phosphate dehydrogenase/oxidase [Hoeflea poritis]MDA4846638.1 glycerol-3-phosphate dehydrogenase/oxidase [Hoeflea poritis]
MSKTRQQIMAELHDDGGFDAIVVGGGVNGIGVYRELSLQGLRVLLVERHDFCSGCSAAPSRMIHGGLRYLENGEFGLVRESLRERDGLLKTAPHMVKPLPTLIPITSVFSGSMNAAASFLGWSGKPANRGILPIKLGLMLYDWVTRDRRRLPKHQVISAKQARRSWPVLTRQARFAAIYHDAWITHPERLCVEMIADMASAAPASVAINYAELTAGDDGLVVTCRRTGIRQPVTARALVNATGAWIDSTIQALGNAAGKKLVSGTKGSHLIIDNPELRSALNGHMVYYENVDGRVCIAFPYQGYVLAGSTDIRVDRPARVRCEDHELDYILGAIGQVFPDIDVTRQQVVFSFSGIRPLPESDHGFTGRITRGHFVHRLDGPIPQFCMIGGKWTTFRAFAEQTADEVLKELGHERRCQTPDMPIGGGRDFEPGGEKILQRLIRDKGIPRQRAEHLIGHYGSCAEEIAHFCQEGDDEPLAGALTPYTSREIAYLIRNEQVETIADLALRRTSLAITGAVSLDLIDSLAAIMTTETGLSSQEIADQRDSLIRELDDYYGVSLQSLQERNHARSQQCA